MADKRPLEDTDLEGLFADARATAPVPSDDLIARVMADAEAQARPEAAPGAPGLWAAILAAIGGWPAATGLATATVAGLAIGLGAPATLETLTGGYLASAAGGYELEDLLPSYADLLGEG